MHKLFIVVSILLLSACSDQGPLDSDGEAIQKLIDNGSDVTKPHQINFYFDFNESKGAKKTCARLKTEGFVPLVTTIEGQELHTCRAAKSMVPELRTMRDLTTRFTILAKKLGGKYDGWDAETVE